MHLFCVLQLHFYPSGCWSSCTHTLATRSVRCSNREGGSWMLLLLRLLVVVAVLLLLLLRLKLQSACCVRVTH